MKKNILILVIIGILTGGYFAYSMYNKPHRDVSEEVATYTLTSNQIFDDFENDEELANKKYLDKTIQVSGKIIEINKDQSDNTVLTLEAENAMIGGVLCTTKDKSIIFEEDSEISLKCRCTGFLMDVIFIDCSVVD